MGVTRAETRTGETERNAEAASEIAGVGEKGIQLASSLKKSEISPTLALEKRFSFAEMAGDIRERVTSSWFAPRLWPIS